MKNNAKPPHEEMQDKYQFKGFKGEGLWFRGDAAKLALTRFIFSSARADAERRPFDPESLP